MLYPRVSLYALMLAAAGIPLYIHLPQFAAINLGLGLGTIGVILLAIRVVDMVQDPFIGWAIDRWPGAQTAFAMLAAAGLAVGFPMLFWLEPGPQVAWRLTGVLVLLFSAYSLGSILLYGRSATLAERHNRDDLLAGIDLSQQDDLVVQVLMDMARTETKPRTERLADSLVEAIKAAGIKMHRRPRQEGAFSVLKSPDIPAVLLELGFLSSAGDLERLTDSAWRQSMALAIRDGLKAWAVDDAARAALP